MESQSWVGPEGSHLELQLSQWLAAKWRYGGAQFSPSVLVACGWTDRKRRLLHYGSVNHRLDVVPPVPRVDHPLSLRLPDDLLFFKDAVEPHVWRFRLQGQTQDAVQHLSGGIYSEQQGPCVCLSWGCTYQSWFDSLGEFLIQSVDIVSLGS